MPVFDRILVTGGTGFLGRYILQRLVEQGHRPLSTTFKENETPLEPAVAGSVDLIETDLTDRDKTKELISSYHPQIVVHLAGTTGHNDPAGERCRRVNYDATVNLLDALAGSDVMRVVLIGTAAEYGDQLIPFNENMRPQALSHYGVSKVHANEHAIRLHAASGLPVTILRVFTAFGYGQPHKMFLSQLITHALLNKQFMMSDGLQKRDFVSIEDVTSAILAALTEEKAVGRVINIGSGRGVRLCDVAEAVWKACDADRELLQIGAVEKTGDAAFDTEADISLARELLDWSPSLQILEGAEPSDALLDTISRMKRDLLPV
jgi:nucleoside-diphosphate-sugar epimerase